MSGINSQYIPLNYLQEYFVKIAGASGTGLPLAGGVVNFYQDNAHTTPKEVFELTGSPSAGYTYTSLGSSLTLGANGTFVDPDGNDITVYAYPYDSNENIQLYYIEVYSSLSEFQFSRQGVPNTAQEISPSTTISKNFISNGQFLIQNLTQNNGVITISETPVTPGGWYYYTDGYSSGNDSITFTPFGSYTSDPTASPKYSCTIVCTSFTGSYKEFGFTFNDVNKFSSPSSAPQAYTLYLEAKSNTGNITIPVVVDKYFGDGSPTTQSPVQVGQVNLTTSYQSFNIQNIVFGNNVGSTITVNDSVTIGLSFPAGAGFNVSITNVALVFGNQTLTVFPDQSNFEFQYEAIVPSIPSPVGNDLLLPVIITKNGLAYDHSIFGKIFPCTYAVVQPLSGELLCDGTTYFTNQYSSDGVPYSRLGNVLYNSTLHLPQFGTGSQFVTASARAVTNLITISQNSPGTITSMSDGSTPTGFTFATISPGFSSPLAFGMWNGSYLFSVLNLYNGTALAPSTNAPINLSVLVIGTPTVSQQIMGAVTVLPSAGQYVDVGEINASYTESDYYVWYKVNGSGTKPSVVGTGIELDILSTFSINDVAQLTGQAFSGFAISQVSNIVAGSTLNKGAFFHLYTQAGTHYVYYYVIDGQTIVPTVSGATVLPVNVSAVDNAATVTTKTIDAINKTAFAVPDLRGDFIRITNGATTEDPGPRWSWLNGPAGNNIGSWENYDIYSHTHISSTLSGALGTHGIGSSYEGGSGLDQDGNQTPYIYPTGGYESRPVNLSFQAVIKY